MRRSASILLALILAITALALPAGAQAPPDAQPLASEDQLDSYQADVTAEQFRTLRQEGFDIADVEARGERLHLRLMLTERDLRRAEDLGVAVEEQVNVNGDTAAEAAALQAQEGFTVYRPYSGPGGIAEEMQALAAQYPRITKLEVIGQSVQGQDIYALRITRNAQRVPIGRRPAVHYHGVQHAREWIAAEMTTRLMNYYVQGYGTNPEITDLVDTRDIWIVPVVNPDGYDYTFTPGNRLWRKNLRDNDGDNQITIQDGVDPNRNWPEKWGWDNEGSSPVPSDQTYRGTGPASEPEIQALDGLLQRVKPKFAVDYHSFGPLLLYPYGFQQQTETADNPLYVALSGTDDNPAIEGYDPDLAAELYITNGAFDDHAHFQRDAIAWTPELNEGCDGCGFVFPDDEALVQAEFERNLPFALSLAHSADDPANPETATGLEAPNFEVDSFAVSHGDPQTVQVTAKRELGLVLLRYRINGGLPRAALAREYDGGEVYYQEDDIYYHRLRGRVRGTRPGDQVEVWFESVQFGQGGLRRERSESFTYSAAVESDKDVLVVAAEDYTGLSPAQAGGPNYADDYVAALAEAGYETDLYDIDANASTSPHPLGVLSHYDAVVVETGADIIPREDGQVPGTVARWGFQLELDARDYLNDGGKLVYAGKNAGFASGANGAYYYNPEDSIQEGECTELESPIYPCLPLFNDFQQYWLGAYTYNVGAGLDGTDGEPFDLFGSNPPYEGTEYSFEGGDGVNNQDAAVSFLPTSDFLPPEEFPQFESSAVLDWARPGAAPYDPFTGEWFVESQQADVSWKRLATTVDLTGAAAGSVEFQISHDTETSWDFVVVEAHPVGSEDWTTLPITDAATGTVVSTQDTGDSCPAAWNTVHPFVDSYQTLNADGTCSPTGTTGDWHGLTGNSGGWQRYSVDLSGYAGAPVEVSISYISDFAVQGIGVFVDDAAVIVDGAAVSETSFEEDLGVWTVPGPPPGSTNVNDWVRSMGLFDEGAAVITDDTVYFGFGVEGLSTLQQRADLLGRAMEYLLTDD